MRIDLDRGVMQRFHPQGMKISMYIDSPGVYLTENSEPVAVELAEAAGFDTKKHAKDKIKQEKTAAFKAQLERDMASEEDAIGQALSGDGKVDVRPIGGGQYAIFDKSGKKLTKVAMSRADAEAIVGPIPEAIANDAAQPGAGA